MKHAVGAVLVGLAAGCAAPIEVPASGYVDVTLPPPALSSEITGVLVAGVPAASIRTDESGEVTVLVQGSPERGRADVVYVHADGQEEVLKRAVEVVGSEDPVLDRVVAVGASLTMGVQGGIPLRHGQLHAPTLQVAQALGAYHPVPLLVDPLLEPIRPEDLGPAPACIVPDVAGNVASQVPGIINRFAQDDGEATYSDARVTPDLVVYNLGVGGSNVGSIVDGATPGALDESITGGMVYGGDDLFGRRPEGSQYELLLEIEPTVILNTDLYGNDIIGAILASGTIKPSRMTDADVLGQDIDRVTADLAATGAQVFLPTLPRPTLLPATEASRQAEIEQARQDAIDKGEDADAAAEATAADIDARLDVILERWAFANERLRTQVALYDNVHLVDLAAATEELGADPPVLDGEQLVLGKLGGLLSTDDLHFSDTGYAFVADVILERMEEELGVSATPIDLEAVYKGDPYSAKNLREAGVDPVDCRR